MERRTDVKGRQRGWRPVMEADLDRRTRLPNADAVSELRLRRGTPTGRRLARGVSVSGSICVGYRPLQAREDGGMRSALRPRVRAAASGGFMYHPFGLALVAL